MITWSLRTGDPNVFMRNDADWMKYDIQEPDSEWVKNCLRTPEYCVMFLPERR